VKRILTLLVLVSLSLLIGCQSEPVIEEKPIQQVKVFEVEEKLNLSGEALIYETIPNLRFSPFIIDVLVLTGVNEDIYINLHVNRSNLTTQFKVLVNDHTISTYSNESEVEIKIDKEYLLPIRNEMKILVGGHEENPPFVDYPLTLYGDSKILSENYLGSEFSIIESDQIQKNNCGVMNGTWELFQSDCSDLCLYARNPTWMCGAAMTYSCECGKDRCWNYYSGGTCEAN
jgi:hypothetical protein